MEQKTLISDEMVIKRAQAAVRIEREKKKALDLPVVTYDRKTQAIYHENSDGTRIKVGERMRKGRYSEHIKQKP
ncbi:MAG: hypothetical protein HFH41_02705 [Lachnospiraceae bacterium]|nr:hypothetical protein [Lachnospiraceae bacterium]